MLNVFNGIRLQTNGFVIWWRVTNVSNFRLRIKGKPSLRFQCVRFLDSKIGGFGLQEPYTFSQKKQKICITPISFICFKPLHRKLFLLHVFLRKYFHISGQNKYWTRHHQRLLTVFCWPFLRKEVLDYYYYTCQMIGYRICFKLSSFFVVISFVCSLLFQ